MLLGTGEIRTNRLLIAELLKKFTQSGISGKFEPVQLMLDEFLNPGDVSRFLIRFREQRTITLNAWFFDEGANGIDLAFNYGILLARLNQVLTNLDGSPLPPAITPFVWTGYNDQMVLHSQTILSGIVIPANSLIIFEITKTDLDNSFVRRTLYVDFQAI